MTVDKPAEKWPYLSLFSSVSGARFHAFYSNNPFSSSLFVQNIPTTIT